MRTWQTVLNKSILKKAMAIAAISIIGTLSSVSVLAYDDEDEAVIEQNIAIMKASLDNTDMTPVINMMPPKIFTRFSKLANVSEQEFKDIMLLQSNSIMDIMSEEGNSIRYQARLEDGKVMQTESGRDYVVIPTEVSMMVYGTGVNMTGTLLALEDDNKWYMLRIEGQHHLNMLEEAYPDMTNIEIFETTTEEFEALPDADATVVL